MSWVTGTASHTWQAVAASGSSLGVRGADVASEVIVTTTVKLLLNPDLPESAKREMLETRDESYIYEPLLGNRMPDLNSLQKE